MAKPYENEHPIKAIGWAARDTSGVLSPFNFSRRVIGEKDMQFKVIYCGICHTDLHQIKNEWGISIYPMVPGHEVVGVVTEIGSKVEKFKVGDKIGVGCLVGSCRKCENCVNDLENYCLCMILTYNGVYTDGTTTYGDYSDLMVVNEHFVVRWPENFPMEATPLLCAGITTYSPLKFAKAFGNKVTVISTSRSKKDEAIEKLGADSFLAAVGLLDGIIDTVSAIHPLLPLIHLLKTHGKLVMVSAPEKLLQLPVFPLLLGRKMVAGRGLGGMKETQEMVDFAAKHNITPDVEVVPMDYVNTAMERLLKSDVKYRFVLDIGNT